MEKLKQLANGMNHRFPEGNEAFQITTRLLEECGEVAKEVNRLKKVELRCFGTETEPRKI